MTEKKRLVILSILFLLSLALLIYTRTHIGHDFVKQLSGSLSG